MRYKSPFRTARAMGSTRLRERPTAARAPAVRCRPEHPDHKKAPGRSPGPLSCFRRRSARREMPVHAGADNACRGAPSILHLERRVRDLRIGSDGLVAETVIEIFELRGPIFHEGPFEAATHGPAHLGLS